jgi:hypothetical protein
MHWHSTSVRGDAATFPELEVDRTGRQHREDDAHDRTPPFGRELSRKLSDRQPFRYVEAARHQSIQGKSYRWKSSLVMKGEVVTHPLD